MTSLDLEDRFSYRLRKQVAAHPFFLSDLSLAAHANAHGYGAITAATVILPHSKRVLPTAHLLSKTSSMRGCLKVFSQVQLRSALFFHLLVHFTPLPARGCANHCSKDRRIQGTGKAKPCQEESEAGFFGGPTRQGPEKQRFQMIRQRQSRHIKNFIRLVKSLKMTC